MMLTAESLQSSVHGCVLYVCVDFYILYYFNVFLRLRSSFVTSRDAFYRALVDVCKEVYLPL